MSIRFGRSFQALAVGLWLLLPGVVLAARPPTSQLLAQADRQVEAGDFEAALITLQDGLSSPDNANDDLVQLYWRMGGVYVFLKREKPAQDAFERLLYLQAGYSPPRLTSPHVRRAFESAREAFLAAGKQVVIDVVPPGSPRPGQPFLFGARLAGMRPDFIARVYFRRALSEAFIAAELRAVDGDESLHEAALPGFPPGTTVEWYVEIEGPDRRRIQGDGSSLAPKSLRMAGVATSLPTAATKPVPGAPSSGWYSKPWVWGVVAATFVAAGVTAYVVSHPDEAVLRAHVTVTP